MCPEDEAEHEDVSDNATAHDAGGVLPAGCTCERGRAGLWAARAIWAARIIRVGSVLQAGLVLLTVPPQVRKLPAVRTFPARLSSPRADYATAPPPPTQTRVIRPLRSPPNVGAQGTAA